MDDGGRAEATKNSGGFRRLRGTIGGNPDVKRLALADRRFERRHRLLKWRVRVKAVRLKDIDIVEAKSFEALVETGEKLFAASPFPVWPRPQAIAGLGRDDEFVAV